jgi:hypothetical protein
MQVAFKSRGSEAHLYGELGCRLRGSDWAEDRELENPPARDLGLKRHDSLPSQSSRGPFPVSRRLQADPGSVLKL